MYTKEQKRFVEEFLLGGGHLSSNKAKELWRVINLPALITSMRNSGFSTIKTVRTSGMNKAGTKVYFAVYHVDPCPECGSYNKHYHCRCRGEE